LPWTLVTPDQAGQAVKGACALLVPDYPNLTPRLLDHTIWKYQRELDDAASAEFAPKKRTVS
jgi:hypothetical protein